MVVGGKEARPRSQDLAKDLSVHVDGIADEGTRAVAGRRQGLGKSRGRQGTWRAAPDDLPVGGAEEADFVRQMENKLVDQLHQNNADLGFQFLAIKQRGLAASSGATPFDILFLALSFFVIAAALLLVALLFRLDVERRASEIGILLAVGFRRRLTTRLLVVEGTIVAAAGGLIGVAAGVGYAWLMLAGLRSWWLGAIVTPFLQLYVSQASLAIGYISGVVVCVLTIVWSVFRMKRLAVRQLLAGQATEDSKIVYSNAGRWTTAVSLACLVASVCLAFAATRLGGEAQAGAVRLGPWRSNKAAP